MEYILINNTALFYAVNHINSPFLDWLMPIISDLGNLIFWLFICVLLFLFGEKKGRNVAILAIIALILSSVVVGLLKYSIAEPRPFVTLQNVKLLTDSTLGYYASFPSGHTASSFAFAVVVGLKYKIKSFGNLRLIYPLLVYAMIVGFSRIYIGVHYPIDVLFGALIGIICAIIVLKFENKILRKNDKPTTIKNIES